MELLKKLRNKLWNWKIDLELLKFDLEHKQLIKTHCDKGYHRFTVNSVKTTKGKKILLDVTFGECIECRELLFFSKKDKKDYHKYYRKLK